MYTAEPRAYAARKGKGSQDAQGILGKNNSGNQCVQRGIQGVEIV